jgi:hypothetical protein
MEGKRNTRVHQIHTLNSMPNRLFIEMKITSKFHLSSKVKS